MDKIEPAAVLHVGLEHLGGAITFPYRIDNRFAGALKVTYPFELDPAGRALLPPIGVGVAAFIAQLCLARRLVLEFPCSLEMVQGILPMLEMTYDIRCWRDGLDLLPLPEVILASGEISATPPITASAKTACLLWSGGKDSTLSSILLSKNGYTVHPVHIPMDAKSKSTETLAVKHLSEILRVAYQTVQYDFPQYLDIAKEYAILWDIFPGYNVVPFGRDLLLALLATPVAQRQRASYLCMGHEHGTRVNYFHYKGKLIARDDVESAKGGELLGAYLSKFVSPNMRFFPPVGGLSEYRILHHLITQHPDVMACIAFCFWGEACGRCSKCLRYYLVQRVLGREDLMEFQVNPLEEDNCLDLQLCIENWRKEEGRSYTNMVFYCLAKLVERGDIRLKERWLRQFADTIYPHLQADVEAMEQSLMQVHSDPQVPAGFHVD